LLMVAGFDRYFQIAPCFRDEDPRADRLPGEFYQLDLEMSFVTQEEVWDTMEPVMAGVFESFADGRKVTPAGEFPRIPYSKAMLDYGTDKPDLRNPLIIHDVTDHFRKSGFGLFERIVEGGGVVRAIPAPNTAEKSRKFFDDMNDWARSEGHAGLGYVTRKGGEFGGPIAKNHGEEGMKALYEAIGLGPDDGCFFAAGKEESWQVPHVPEPASSLIWWKRMRSVSAGLSISPSTNGTKRKRSSILRTTRFPCRKAVWRRWKRKTR
jgi:aspartyl-tRNA synthetase